MSPNPGLLTIELMDKMIDVNASEIHLTLSLTGAPFIYANIDVH